MTRWFHPSERNTQRSARDLDPVSEGAHHGLSREQALALWHQACHAATDPLGVCDHERAWNQFCARAQGSRSRRPEIGKRTRVSFERAGADHSSAVGLVPGRTSLVLRHATSDDEVPHNAEDVAAARRQLGAGQAVPTELRQGVEAELGVSLASARLHTDATATRAARALRAEAFTIGVDIFFAASKFAPGTRAGHKLLAHELTHVAQAIRGQTGSVTGESRVSRPGEPLEREAEEVAERVPARAPAIAHASSGYAAFQPPNIARSATLLRSPGDPPTPPKGPAQRLHIDLDDLVVVHGSDGHSFKPRSMRAEPALKEVKLADKIAAGAGDQFVFPPTTNQPAIDGFLRKSGRPAQFKTLTATPQAQPSAVVKHANSAFAKATGWSDVDLHIEAHGATKAEVIARWTQPNRVPAVKPMPGGRITRIRVHCQDGVVDLPVPSETTGGTAAATSVIPKPPSGAVSEALPKPSAEPAPKTLPTVREEGALQAGARPVVEPGAAEATSSTRAPTSATTATSEMAEVAETVGKVQRLFRGMGRGLAVFLSAKVQVPLAIVLELLNAMQMMEMAKSKLEGNGFLLTEAIARAKKLQQDTADELSVYRDRYHADLSGAIQDGMVAIFRMRSQRALGGLKSEVPAPLQSLRQIEASWVNQRAQLAAIEREAREKQTIAEQMLSSKDFYAATALTGTALAATVFAASQDLSEVAGAAGAAGVHLDVALELVREDIAWLSWISSSSL